MSELLNGKSRISVLQLARLGDFLQTTPLLAALKTRRPDCQVQVIVQPAQAPLAWASGLADEVYLLDPNDLQNILEQDSAWPLKAAQLRGQLAFLRNLPSSEVYNLNLSPLAALAAAYMPSSNVRGWRFLKQRLCGEDWMAFIMAMAGQRRLSRMHLSDILASYADPPSPPLSRLAFAEQPQAAARAQEMLERLPGPLVGLQLGANHRLRRWPNGNFVGLARQLAGQGVNLVLLGSHREKPLAEKFLQRLGPQRALDLMGRTDLPTLASLLARLDVLVSSDTGTLHLATAVGTTCLALYMGPAQVHETGPYGEGHLTLQARPPCAPCVESNPLCKGQAACRYLINPDIAARACLALLQKQSPIQAAGSLALHNEVGFFAGRFDGFGLTYQPLDKPCFTSESALALSLREMGRIILRSRYRSSALAQEIRAAYAPARTADKTKMAALSQQLRFLAQAREERQGWLYPLEPVLDALRPLEKNPPPRLTEAWLAAAQAMEEILAY